jgi:AcrR family transcriptional regulator
MPDRSGRDSAADEPGTEAAATHMAALVPVTARGEATRRRILDAAEDVFGEMGYYEASVSEITRRAGVAQGTFYIYFHSKRETFIELVEDIGDRLRATTSAAIQDAPNRIEAERLGYAAFFWFVYAHRRIYRIVEDAGRVAPEVAREYYRRISLGYEHGLRAAIVAGEIHDTNEEAIGYALMGIAHFLALRWIIWPAEDDTGPEQTPTEPGQMTIPAGAFDAVVAFIARGLAGDRG